MIDVTPVPALRDNYVWLVSRAGQRDVAIIDPGDAAPVLAALDTAGLVPCAVIATHHHWDHTQGIGGLLERYPSPVYGPALESIPHLTRGIADGETLQIPELGMAFEALHVPGHTRGATAWYGHGCLFSGDTLFSAGCGRLFEGTAAQMHASLGRLARLPPETRVYCGHEYTAANLRFAQTVEPHNETIRARLEQVLAKREADLPTLPSTLAIERETNPFLRCDRPEVRAAAERHAGRVLETPLDVFTVLRAWKDTY